MHITLNDGVTSKRIDISDTVEEFFGGPVPLMLSYQGNMYYRVSSPRAENPVYGLILTVALEDYLPRSFS